MPIIKLEIKCDGNKCDNCDYLFQEIYYISYCKIYNTAIFDDKRCFQCIDACEENTND